MSESFDSFFASARILSSGSVLVPARVEAQAGDLEHYGDGFEEIEPGDRGYEKVRAEAERSAELDQLED